MRYKHNKHLWHIASFFKKKWFDGEKRICAKDKKDEDEKSNTPIQPEIVSDEWTEVDRETHDERLQIGSLFGLHINVTVNINGAQQTPPPYPYPPYPGYPPPPDPWNSPKPPPPQEEPPVDEDPPKEEPPKEEPPKEEPPTDEDPPEDPETPPSQELIETLEGTRDIDEVRRRQMLTQFLKEELRGDSRSSPRVTILDIVVEVDSQEVGIHYQRGQQTDTYPCTYADIQKFLNEDDASPNNSPHDHTPNYTKTMQNEIEELLSQETAAGTSTLVQRFYEENHSTDSQEYSGYRFIADGKTLQITRTGSSPSALDPLAEKFEDIRKFLARHAQSKSVRGQEVTSTPWVQGQHVRVSPNHFSQHKGGTALNLWTVESVGQTQDSPPLQQYTLQSLEDSSVTCEVIGPEVGVNEEPPKEEPPKEEPPKEEPRKGGGPLDTLLENPDSAALLLTTYFEDRWQMNLEISSTERFTAELDLDGPDGPITPEDRIYFQYSSGEIQDKPHFIPVTDLERWYNGLEQSQYTQQEEIIDISKVTNLQIIRLSDECMGHFEGSVSINLWRVDGVYYKQPPERSHCDVTSIENGDMVNVVFDLVREDASDDSPDDGDEPETAEVMYSEELLEEITSLDREKRELLVEYTDNRRAGDIQKIEELTRRIDVIELELQESRNGLKVELREGKFPKEKLVAMEWAANDCVPHGTLAEDGRVKISRKDIPEFQPLGHPSADKALQDFRTHLIADRDARIELMESTKGGNVPRRQFDMIQKSSDGMNTAIVEVKNTVKPYDKKVVSGLCSLQHTLAKKGFVQPADQLLVAVEFIEHKPNELFDRLLATNPRSFEQEVQMELMNHSMGSREVGAAKNAANTSLVEQLRKRQVGLEGNIQSRIERECAVGPQDDNSVIFGNIARLESIADGVRGYINPNVHEAFRKKYILPLRLEIEERNDKKTDDSTIRRADISSYIWDTLEQDVSDWKVKIQREKRKRTYEGHTFTDWIHMVGFDGDGNKIDTWIPRVFIKKHKQKEIKNTSTEPIDQLTDEQFTSLCRTYLVTEKKNQITGWKRFEIKPNGHLISIIGTPTNNTINCTKKDIGNFFLAHPSAIVPLQGGPIAFENVQHTPAEAQQYVHGTYHVPIEKLDDEPTLEQSEVVMRVMDYISDQVASIPKENVAIEDIHSLAGSWPQRDDGSFAIPLDVYDDGDGEQYGIVFVDSDIITHSGHDRDNKLITINVQKCTNKDSIAFTLHQEMGSLFNEEGRSKKYLADPNAMAVWARASAYLFCSLHEQSEPFSEELMVQDIEQHGGYVSGDRDHFTGLWTSLNNPQVIQEKGGDPRKHFDCRDYLIELTQLFVTHYREIDRRNGGDTEPPSTGPQPAPRPPVPPLPPPPPFSPEDEDSGDVTFNLKRPDDWENRMRQDGADDEEIARAKAGGSAPETPDTYDAVIPSIFQEHHPETWPEDPSALPKLSPEQVGYMCELLMRPLRPIEESGTIEMDGDNLFLTMSNGTIYHVSQDRYAEVRESGPKSKRERGLFSATVEQDWEYVSRDVWKTFIREDAIDSIKSVRDVAGSIVIEFTEGGDVIITDDHPLAGDLFDSAVKNAPDGDDGDDILSLNNTDDSAENDSSIETQGALEISIDDAERLLEIASHIDFHSGYYSGTAEIRDNQERLKGGGLHIALTGAAEKELTRVLLLPSLPECSRALMLMCDRAGYGVIKPQEGDVLDFTLHNVVATTETTNPEQDNTVHKLRFYGLRGDDFKRPAKVVSYKYEPPREEPEIPAKKYVNAPEAALFLEISEKELDRLRGDGKIRGFLDRKEWKFRRGDLIQLKDDLSQAVMVEPDAPPSFDPEDTSTWPPTVQRLTEETNVEVLTAICSRLVHIAPLDRISSCAFFDDGTLVFTGSRNRFYYVFAGKYELHLDGDSDSPLLSPDDIEEICDFWDTDIPESEWAKPPFNGTPTTIKMTLDDGVIIECADGRELYIERDGPFLVELYTHISGNTESSDGPMVFTPLPPELQVSDEDYVLTLYQERTDRGRIWVQNFIRKHRQSDFDSYVQSTGFDGKATSYIAQRQEHLFDHWNDATNPRVSIGEYSIPRDEFLPLFLKDNPREALPEEVLHFCRQSPALTAEVIYTASYTRMITKDTVVYEQAGEHGHDLIPRVQAVHPAMLNAWGSDPSPQEIVPEGENGEIPIVIGLKSFTTVYNNMFKCRKTGHPAFPNAGDPYA